MINEKRSHHCGELGKEVAGQKLFCAVGLLKDVTMVA